MSSSLVKDFVLTAVGWFGMLAFSFPHFPHRSLLNCKCTVLFPHHGNVQTGSRKGTVTTSKQCRESLPGGRVDYICGLHTFCLTPLCRLKPSKKDTCQRRWYGYSWLFCLWRNKSILFCHCEFWFLTVPRSNLSWLKYH